MKKVFWWVLGVIVAGLFWRVGEYADYQATLPTEAEKQAITVYAPEDMETAFNNALKVANLEETHKIVMVEDNNANICVEYAKQNDADYQKLAFTPFVVAYNTSSNNKKKLAEVKVLLESPYDDDYLEVDFLKIINEAIGEGKWANLNLEDENELKIFYPGEDTIYWHDFHDFLLVTVNNGKYPKTETEMQKAEETIEKFINSDCTEGVTNFYEQVQRTGGFPTSVIYILTEKDALDICSKQSKNANTYYPTNVVYFNYYIKVDENGKQISDYFDKIKGGFPSDYNFFHRLAEKRYRNDKYSDLKASSDNVGYERDIYNAVKIPKILEFTANDTNPTSSTEATIPTSE